MSDKPRVLFVPKPAARAGWYRCVLPAMFGGYDWASISGEPPALEFFAGWVGQENKEPDFLNYDVVVLQQARGERWRGLIKKMRENGVVVLYEMDDYVHGIRNSPDHDFRGFFLKHHLKAMEICMRQCNGAIFSTQFLADKYERLVRRSWVCENGLDLGRYRLTRPPRGDVNGRETVTILWAGATGHQLAVIPWIYAVADVLRQVPHASFVSIGQDFGAVLHDEFPDRVISVPFTSLESYPAAMMLGDVSIAPAGTSDWYRAKSDLRAMESAALGIPVVADRKYSAAVDHERTGLLVRAAPATMSGDEAVVPPGAAAQVVPALRRLVEDDDLRLRMSEASRRKAEEEFGMQGLVEQWHRVLREAAGPEV